MASESLEFKDITILGVNARQLSENIPMLVDYLYEGGNPNKYGRENLLEENIKNKRYEQLELLFNYGANPNYNPTILKHMQDEPLIIALKNNDLRAAEMIIRYGAELNDRSRIPPIVWCAQNSKHDGVKLLLSHGANPNYHYYQGQPAIFYAIDRNDVEMVKILLEAGADFKSYNYFSEVVSRMDKNPEKRARIACLLLEYGADPNVEIYGKPVLHYIIDMYIRQDISKEIAIDLMTCFLEKGINISQKYQGNTALEYAQLRNLDEEFIYLLETYSYGNIKDPGYF